MWDGKKYKCLGCGEVYCNNYAICPSCHAPCVVVKEGSGNFHCGKSQARECGEGVVVAEILRCEKFLGACLYKLIVSDGSAYWPVVSGAHNCRKGLRTAFAKVGSLIRNCQTGEWVEVKKSIVKGEYSSGMLCSSRELVYPKGEPDALVEFCDSEVLGRRCADVEYIIDRETGQRIHAPWQKDDTCCDVSCDVSEPCVKILSVAQDSANKNLFWMRVEGAGYSKQTYGYGDRFCAGQIVPVREIEGLYKGF